MMSKVVSGTGRNKMKKVETHVPMCKQEFEKQGENDGEDRISQLPERIILMILSLLTVQDLMSTSVLSRRWQFLWTSVDKLNFDVTRLLQNIKLHARGFHECTSRFLSTNVDLEGEEKKYVNLLEQVMKSNRAPSVELLRICFDLGRGRYDNHDHVKEWIAFATKKKVKKLELDMSPVQDSSRYIEKIPIMECVIESLVELRLAWLDITGEIIDSILLGCPLLKHLAVRGSKTLINLKVTGPALQLKCLEIYECPLIKKFEISAENIRTFKYGDNSRPELLLINTPLLTELYFGGYYCMTYIENISRFSSLLPQLEVLGFDMRVSHSYMINIDFSHFPVLKNLKEIELKLRVDDDENLLGLIALLKVSASLQKFSLWLDCCPDGKDRKVEVAEKFRHNHLKVVELHGFVGCAVDMELSNYFVENAVALEKFIIYCGSDQLSERACSGKETQIKQSAMKNARSLGKRLRPGVTMFIH